MENIYVQLDGMVPTNNGDSYRYNMCSTYSQLISILWQEGFYVNPPEIQTVFTS